MEYRKKLIEVALPLEAINAESAREKSIRHGHPSTLHLWWARRPLAACRAVLWASLVDDPSSWPERFPTEEAQKQERQRLFDILARFETVTDKKGKTNRVVRGLVSWNDINDVDARSEVAVLVAAQREIARCLAWAREEEAPEAPDEVRAYIVEHAPPAYDPFAGGGSIPLEAQRLGLEAHASDLNPVAVLINKALIEIPPKFKDMPPVNPKSREVFDVGQWRGAQGLAEDVRYYGQWMRDEAFKRIGHLYPQVELPEEKGGGKATVIAWLWARTVVCPNPACGCQMPLVKSFKLSTKKGKEAWVSPVVDRTSNPPRIVFDVKMQEGEVPEGTMGRKGAVCVVCEAPVPFDYIRAHGRAIGMKSCLMAIVAESESGRVYISSNQYHIETAKLAQPIWKPEAELPNNTRDIRPQIYGLPTYGDLFTPRQLVTLTTLYDLVGDARQKAVQDITTASTSAGKLLLSKKGTNAESYGNAIATYLAFAVDKMADYHSSLCSWHSGRDTIRNTFGRQAIPMVWDFAEANPMSSSTGNLNGAVAWVCKVIEKASCSSQTYVCQHDAPVIHHSDSTYKIISTDPPYFDNIGYADLSDFFYVWLRRAIGSVYPSIFSTLLVPKAQELVATPYRFGGSKQKAKDFFEKGLGRTFSRLNSVTAPNYPLTIYYAFKQEEFEVGINTSEATASTGWETMLEGLIGSQFSICGTWPMRSEMSNRMIADNTNALSSSIVLVCNLRSADAIKITRRQFFLELKQQLPKALKTLQQGNIAPVDLAQASIGPGMAIFSKYAAVLESDGTPMRVRTALQLINQTLDEYLTEQEGDFDTDTRWALTWYEQYQFTKAPYGEAETLSKAKNTSVQGLVDSGILEAESGKVRLFSRSDLPVNWDPTKDNRTPDWEATQHLIHRLETQGETNAAQLLSHLGSKGENARDLAYRLYTLCDRKGWSKEALAYNSLVIAWPEISRLANEQKRVEPRQTSLFV